MIDKEEEEEICICSHAKEDHHISWIRGGYELVEECEYYGSNETGGMIQIGGKWIGHCQHYKKDENPGPQFVEFDFEALFDELEQTDPGIRQRVAELTAELKTQWDLQEASVDEHGMPNPAVMNKIIDRYAPDEQPEN